MPRRRRPRCKVKPLIALRENAGESEASQDDQLESRSDDVDTTTDNAHDAAPASVPASDWEYRLFPELHNQLPCLPSYADIFGQHSDIIYQEPHMPACRNGSLSVFGLSGLVANLRATKNNANAVQLVTGEDLTTYGLDLASQGDIYVHFNGPFTQQPAVRSSANCALELGMRGMRDAMDKYPTKPPVWESFVPETRNLGLLQSVPKLAQPSHKKSS